MGVGTLSRAESSPPSPFRERNCQRKFTLRSGIWSATRRWQEGLASRAWPVPAKASHAPEEWGTPRHSWDSQCSVCQASRLVHADPQVSCPTSELTFVSWNRLSDMAGWDQPSGNTHSGTPAAHCVISLTTIDNGYSCRWGWVLGDWVMRKKWVHPSRSPKRQAKVSELWQGRVEPCQVLVWVTAWVEKGENGFGRVVNSWHNITGTIPVSWWWIWLLDF